ncbi:MAG: hypothetical protein HRU26_00935 [Psychroserpens sp.]|nr:hypothetical protein [Psychroserpens sp.]
MELHKLSDPLEVGDIDFKPAQVNVFGDNVFCNILAYKDARVDMHRLDEVVGQENWQNEYKRDSNGVLQCGIGIRVEYINGDVFSKDWVWKWSNGTPSQFEKEKGEYSDAFKRAGFMWGIGRELYDYPQIRVTLMEKEYTRTGDNQIKVNGYFKPNSWKWLLDWEHPESGSFKLVAYQYIGNKKHLRYDSNPYNSKNQRT